MVGTAKQKYQQYKLFKYNPLIWRAQVKLPVSRSHKSQKLLENIADLNNHDAVYCILLGEVIALVEFRAGSKAWSLVRMVIGAFCIFCVLSGKEKKSSKFQITSPD